jgi:hypothetical protein
MPAQKSEAAELPPPLLLEGFSSGGEIPKLPRNVLWKQQFHSAARILRGFRGSKKRLGARKKILLLFKNHVIANNQRQLKRSGVKQVENSVDVITIFNKYFSVFKF